MAPTKRQDETEIQLIMALLSSLSRRHEALFDKRALTNTINIVKARYASEGISFLTKTLPRLAKAFDKSLAGGHPLNATELRFAPLPSSQLPRFLGELFKEVLDSSGVLLQEARADIVRDIRQVLVLFYKYELPYSTDQEQEVISKFVKTENELSALTGTFDALRAEIPVYSTLPIRRENDLRNVTRRARRLLNVLFSGVLKRPRTIGSIEDPFSYCLPPLDLSNITPSHGPGAVATRQRLWAKYDWTNVSSRITAVYPLDAYFYASLGAVCDNYRAFSKVSDKDLPARVVLVPKDSRGPRLISCEPVDFQWVQQGIARALVGHVERHPLTRHNVHFTDQSPNRCGALLGSLRGGFATLDLNEASDRVSLALVRLLFPPHIVEYLEAARSVGTVLPDGSTLTLQKFAPMGSSLCFPILALTIWSLLTAAAPDKYTRERILVFGDDVIVPTAYAGKAMEQLESFGLKINRDKSCISGLFRESCGQDAFKGSCVTPTRFKSVWSSVRRSDTYVAWIAYANSMFRKGYFEVYDKIVDSLLHVYGEIPSQDMGLTCPFLVEVPELARPRRSRVNARLQKRQYYVWDVKAKRVEHEMDGWSMLLRYFTEASKEAPDEFWAEHVPVHTRVPRNRGDDFQRSPFSVREYTPRSTSMLVRTWR